MFTARLTSSTKVSGQISLRSSSFARSLPRLRTRHTNVSKTFGVRGRAAPLRERTRSAGSKENGPNSYISFSISDIGVFRSLLKDSKRGRKTFRRLFGYFRYFGEGPRRLRPIWPGGLDKQRLEPQELVGALFGRKKRCPLAPHSI